MNTDPIADMLTRIRNGLARQFKTVEIPDSKIKQAIAEILVKQGYLEKFEVIKSKEKKHPYILVTIRYYGKQPVLNGLDRISKPGQRIYLTKTALKKSLKSRIEEIIVSTSKGLMTGTEAVRNSLGGEILFKVY